MSRNSSTVSAGLCIPSYLIAVPPRVALLLRLGVTVPLTAPGSELGYPERGTDPNDCELLHGLHHVGRCPATTRCTATAPLEPALGLTESALCLENCQIVNPENPSPWNLTPDFSRPAHRRPAGPSRDRGEKSDSLAHSLNLLTKRAPNVYSNGAAKQEGS